MDYTIQSTNLYLKGYKDYSLGVHLKKKQGLQPILACLWSLPVLCCGRMVKIDMDILKLLLDHPFFSRLEQKLLSSRIINCAEKVKPKCPICMDTLFSFKRTVITSCSHQFHVECLDAWLVPTSTTLPVPAREACPLCRTRPTSLLYQEDSIVKACLDNDLLILKAAYNADPMIMRKKYKSPSDGESYFLVEIASQSNSERALIFLIEKEEEAVNASSN